jgi:hypothetical protein
MSKLVPAGLAVLVSAAVLVAAGCGGSSRNKAYAGSKTAFAAAMNSICASANAKQKALGTISNLSDIATQGPQLETIVNDAIKQLAKLEPPAEIKSNVDDFISLTKQQAVLLKAVVKAAKANDTAKVQSLGQQGDALNKKGDVDANAIGAPACLSTAK